MLEDAIESTNPNQEEVLNMEFGPKVLEFKHGRWLRLGQFSVRKIENPLQSANEVGVKITIWDSNNEQHGLIHGVLETTPDDRRKYKVSTARNTHYRRKGHVRRLLSKAISEIVVNRVVDEWVSSTTQSKQAKAMYDRLAKDKRLFVRSTKKSGELWNQFIVTKR